MARHRVRERNRAVGEDPRPGGEVVAASRRLLASPDEAVALLSQAEVVGYQEVPSGSNFAFFLLMAAEGHDPFLTVYKPRRGENPLWDFPEGTLYRRERAAYVAARALGWPNVPPTVIREGPAGVGSLQLYVPAESRANFFTLRDTHRRTLMEVALFDLLVNNADRKGGHFILGPENRIWVIDHGLTFNTVYKLRTVMWDYCGEPIPAVLMSRLRHLLDGSEEARQLRSSLLESLAPEEVDAFFARLQHVLHSGRYPLLDPNCNIPWPLV